MEHRSTWNCAFCQKEGFIKLREFQQHLRQRHTADVTDDQLEALSEASKVPATSIPALSCPFCDEWEQKLRIANSTITKSDVLVVTPVSTEISYKDTVVHPEAIGPLSKYQFS